MKIASVFRPFLASIGIAVLSSLGVSDPAYAQFQQGLRDWQVSCSASGDCSAETTATGRTDATTYRFTLIFRRASQDAPWRMAIRMVNAEPATSSALVLQIDDGADFRFEPDEILSGGDREYELTGAGKIDALMAAFRGGDKLWLTFHNPRIRETGLAFSLNGAVASFTRIEEQQVSDTGAVPIPDLVTQMQSLDPNCDSRNMPDLFTPESYQVSDNQWLHILPCNLGAYNFVSRLYIENRQFDEVFPLHFATYSEDNGWGGTNALLNVEFDPETNVLTSLAPGRGLGDCGSRAKYVWNEYDFKLLEYAYWEPCDGTRMPADWPIIYPAQK